MSIVLRNLANNHFVGPIPYNISFCTALNQLYVSLESHIYLFAGRLCVFVSSCVEISFVF